MTDLFANAWLVFPLLLWAKPVTSLSRSNLTSAFSGVGVSKEMMYTQNSLCRQNYCTNPIFPGVNDLPRLEALQWQCSSTSAVQQHMDFCKDAVAYDPALPSPQSKATPVTELIKAQEDAAMTMFVYHLNGMGYEAWDYRNPSETDNECVRAVWKMVCFTYFPRAEAGCKMGEQSSYKRPCKSSCGNYLQQCNVECCDESVSCVFAHTSTHPTTGETQLLQTGYVDQEGPSAMCTGAAKRSMSSPLLILLGICGLHFAGSSSSRSQGAGARAGRPQGFGKVFMLAFLGLILTLCLQGCDSGVIPRHTIGNWRTKTNYLSEFKVTAAGKDVLNSCSQTDIPSTSVCGGRGYCKGFSMDSTASNQLTSGAPPMSFCQCPQDWADPECGTKRKSQTKAFFWSVFLGFTGADYFYLGFPLWGLGKLFTLGGFGFWWLIDVVRTGVGPVYAHNFRTAHDLPHWVAVLVMVFLGLLAGFAFAISNYLLYRRQKRMDVASLMNSEEARQWKKTEEEMDGFTGPRFRTRGIQNFEKRPAFAGYGATLPIPHPNAATYATSGLDPRTGMHSYAGPFGPAGAPGMGSPTPVGQGLAPTHMEAPWCHGREGVHPGINQDRMHNPHAQTAEAQNVQPGQA